MKKPVVIAIAAIFIIIIVLVVGKKQGWIGQEYQEKVLTEKAQLRTITESITANGKIKPMVEVKISSDVSGEILELLIEEGQEVKRGQMLARIQPDIYERNFEKMQASLKSAEANLLQAEAQLQQKELNYKRNKELWADKTISEAEFEQAESEYEIAKANKASTKAALRNSKASLNEAKDNLNRTSIYAPMDGTISRLNVEKGERVVGTAQFEGTEMMTLANLHQMEVLVDVNENDIIRVSQYDTCLIEVDAYLKQKFKGIVTQIANSAKTQGASADQITNFEVRVLILPESYEHLATEDSKNRYPFRPGMSATVDIQTNTRYNTLTIPIQSVTTRPDTIQSDSTKVEADKDKRLEVVFVVENGKAIQKKVVPGIQNTKHIEILEGLAEEDEVISGPYSAISRKLNNETPVQVVDKLFEDKKE
ncbi:efflux RND transporter periplasmic adaptor subunit [Carboxylicivirga mesophila]|uniref:Efflux RND transporter periplasmic adaptor subunit n=1 Tax=Carboxylicivirga mesophila TaxID=1166478 RepID=A0ABS5KF12_9BACT|nr:efflux RND transporter periplasmic adaptor subunit [Carboxylicivirga mesophila]MBS2213499.1 efflux RND transporter periplasmic adaptor subunit [Carboxylicivirga mesophila]